MDTVSFDVVVIGAGIAGATCAAYLSADHRVALVEAEEAPGYHTTGRSAALWEPNYGPAEVRVLTRASRKFFEQPPTGFTETSLLHRRAIVVVAQPGDEDRLAHAVSVGEGLLPISVDAVRTIVPALRPGYAAAAAINPDAFDIDVAALHQGFLRQHKTSGGVLALRHRTGRISRQAGAWQVETSAGSMFLAPVVVNAAGAWGDEVAAAAGIVPIGLVPKRRTGVIIDPAPWIPIDWPMLCDVGETWYCRPEARTRLMVSPADATPDTAHDVQPDELDVAVAIDRMQQALDIAVRRVERSWAGLRSFTPDGSLAFGWDGSVTGFMWCVGQGGYGIQTSPEAGRIVSDLISGRDPGLSAETAAAMDPRRFAA